MPCCRCGLHKWQDFVRKECTYGQSNLYISRFALKILTLCSFSPAKNYTPLLQSVYLSMIGHKYCANPILHPSQQSDVIDSTRQHPCHNPARQSQAKRSIVHFFLFCWWRQIIYSNFKSLSIEYEFETVFNEFSIGIGTVCHFYKIL